MDSTQRLKIDIQRDKLLVGGKLCDAVYFHLPEQANGFLGNWYPSPFELDGIRFSCVEQYIMYRKCITFGDKTSAEQVLRTTDPAVQKDIAGNASGYVDKVWNGLRQVILMRALVAKFTQNEVLHDALLSTGEGYLVESANKDKIWACGEGLWKEERWDISKWSGDNILGFALMEVRTMLRMQEAAPEARPKSTISVQVNDITTLAVDAIVNAANKSLLGGGGVDGAIHRAAGPQLVRECATLGGCETGDAKITRGYNLPAKYVIHTVGPVYSEKSRDSAEHLLRCCYQNSMDLALKNDIHSIAFPAISTGAYDYPLKDATDVAVRAVKSWMKHHEDYPIDVIFCCFSQEAYDVYQTCLAEIDI